MSVKWTGTIGLVALFALLVILPAALVCGTSLQLLVAFTLGAVVSYLLFAATEHHELSRLTDEGHRPSDGDIDPTFRRLRQLKRKTAVGYACLAIAAWVPYVIVLLSLGWTGWWWSLAIAFVLISVVIVLDLAGTVIMNA